MVLLTGSSYFAGGLCVLLERLSKGPWTLQIGSALLVSGAIGNGIDRYMIHGVVDFFDFRIWPIFNVADIGICVGVALVVYYLFTLKDGFHVQQLSVVTQYGTHIDPPCHFYEGGRFLDEIELKDLLLPLYVIDRSKRSSRKIQTSN